MAQFNCSNAPKRRSPPHCIALDFIISLLSIKYVPVAGVAQGFTNKRDVQWQQVQTPSHFYFKTSNLL